MWHGGVCARSSTNIIRVRKLHGRGAVRGLKGEFE